MKKILAASMLASLMTGCAINQTVAPVANLSDKEVCIVESPKVNKGFLEAYKNTLGSKGYSVRVLPESSSLVECPITSTYMAHWRWDLAMYMAYAEIKVYSHGKPAGSALYDSTRGGGNMNKFIKADKKVEELVNQLFPGRAGA